MVAPITGPFVSYPSYPYSDSFRLTYRQKPPFTEPLKFRYYRYYGFGTWTQQDGNVFTSGSGKQANYGSASHSDIQRHIGAAYSRAYENLKGSIGDRAGWAENLAQIQKTRVTINDRCFQLAKFVKLLKKTDFVGAAKALRTAVPSRVSNRKAISQNFLEYEYGVKPLISDLQTSVGILLSDPGWRRVVGRGTSRAFISKVISTSGYNFTSISVDSAVATISYRVGGMVRVTNPNLYLANQLGIIDIALPWKLVPFSFVVDWFINVEQVLSSVTDWYGLALQKPQRTLFMRGFRSSNLNQYGNNYYYSSVLTRTFAEMERFLDIPSPTLVLKPFKGFSVRRGAQALALVLSTLGR